MTDDWYEENKNAKEPACYGLVVEFLNQAPILMEAEQTSLEEMRSRRPKLSTVIRACIVRLEYVEGNELLLKDLARMQNDQS